MLAMEKCLLDVMIGVGNLICHMALTLVKDSLEIGE